jgi:predicted DCC family thiol-disulfide oxidoreductase YuxK
MVPFQEADDPRVTPELRERAQHEVIAFLADGRVLYGHRAALFVMRPFGLHWRVFGTVATLPGVDFVSRAAYRYLATHRRQFAPWLFTVDYDEIDGPGS